MGHNFTAQWLKGAKNEAADALSRHPYQAPHKGDDLAELDVTSAFNPAGTEKAPSISEIRASTTDKLERENLHLLEVRKHAADDREYQSLKDVVVTGFPSMKSLLPESLKKFWSIKDNLSLDDDLLVYGCRLFVLTSLRATMLSRLHEAHQGIARSQARARLTIYWPGVDRDIENFVNTVCNAWL